MECIEMFECSQCESTFVIVGGECVCPEYHLLNESSGMCYYRVLGLSVATEDEFFLLEFSEDLKEGLSEININEAYLLPGEKEFQIVLKQISLDEYQLRIKIDEIPPDLERLFISFIGVTGTSGAKMINSVNVQITPEEIEDLIEQEGSEETTGIPAVEASLAAIGMGIVGALISSTLTGNLSAIWGFLNISLLLFYVPLHNVDPPAELKRFFSGFGSSIYGYMPNIMQILSIEINCDTDSPEIWQEYDISTTCLLTNLNAILVAFSIGMLVFLLLLVSFLLLKALNKPRWSNSVLGKLKSYRWCFFIRFWIEAYIEAIAALMLTTGTVTPI